MDPPKSHSEALREAMAEDRKLRRWALITGSTRGLGLHLALQLSHARWNLILHGRSIEMLEAAAKTVEVWGEGHPGGTGLVDLVVGDISLPATQYDLARIATDRKISLLINNAGTYTNQSLDSIEPEAIAYAVAVNLMAPMLLSKMCLAVLREKQGLIVNINSMAAHAPSKGESVYAATKAGLEGFSKAWKLETMPIRVIDVFLGAMNTRMTTGRPTPELMIQPEAAARSICAAIETSNHDSSVRFDSLDLRRGWYSSR